MLRIRIPIRVRCTTLCDKVCRWLMVGRWFSPGTPVSSTNKPDRHNKTEISLICGKTIIIALVTFQKRLKVMHACICYLATTSGKKLISSRYLFYSRLLCTRYTPRTVSDLTEWYPRLQYYDVQTLEYRYISKLPMKNERRWSYIKETTSHFQNKITKNIYLGFATSTRPPFSWKYKLNYLPF